MADAIKIRDVLTRDVRQRIEPVVKVYDRSRLAEELRQFVITDSLARELRKLFDAFTESLRSRQRGGRGTDGMAVWLWGFFGSGKSHVAKVVGHLLENALLDEASAQHAMDVFNVHLDDPTLPAANDLKRTLAEVRQHAWCKTILFEIKSKLDQANPDSVTEACLREFYKSLGLAETIWLARLERKLQVDGRYSDFTRLYREQNQRDWETDRQEHGFYLDEIAAALAAALSRSTDSAREMLTAYQRDHARVTPESLARELLEYLNSVAPDHTPREPHLIFVIDEMGQFIGDSSDRIHELQAIIEQAGAQGRGRIWFICTSQEALDQVIGRTGLKLSALGKLDARFSTKIPLTGEDVRRVVQDRLLRKKEAQLPVLQQYYAAHEGAIEELASLRLERKLAVINRESFMAAYPFLPPTIPLVQELFNSMRGFKLSGSERSMIGLAQGALQTLAERPLGTVVALDVVFDQVTDELSASDYLGTGGMRLIREIDSRVPNTPIPASRVLKVLWLIRSEHANWVPRTPEMLAKFLADQFGMDLGLLSRQVRETLERLQKAGLVGRDESTDQYRYLTETERGLEEDIIAHIQDLGAGVGIAKRRAAELLKDKVLTRAKWSDYRITFGQAGIIPFTLMLEDEVVTSSGEIVVRVFSPLAPPDVDDIELQNQGQGVKSRELFWLAADDKTLIEKLKRLDALEKVPTRPKWKNDRNDETARLLKDKERERSSLETHVAGLLEASLRRGKVYYSGEEADLDGVKDLKSLAEEFVGAVASHLYTRFAVADKAFDERNLPVYLKPGKQSLSSLDPALNLFDAQGHLVRSAPLVEALFDELRRRRDERLDLDGRALSEHFGRIPFGWPEALLRLVLAAMFRGGAVYLEPPDSDQPVYDMGTPGIESVFTGPQKFRKTRFYPTSGGLTPAEVKEAKEALIALGETNTPDTAYGLADCLRRVGNRMTQDAERIQQRVQDLNLPLPDVYRRAEPMLNPALKLRDPVAAVRQFIIDRAEWKTLADFLATYANFADQRREVAYRDYVEVLNYARTCAAVMSNPALRETLAEFDAVVTARDVMSKWKVLQEAALAVVEGYRQVYRQAYQACAQAIANLRQDVESAPAFTRLEVPRRERLLAQFFGVNSALALAPLTALDSAGDLRRASERRKVSELEALLKAVPTYRTDIWAACEQEWQVQSAPDAPTPTPARVRRISVSARLAGRRFVSATEFETFWTELHDEIQAALSDGFEVILE